MPSSKTAPHWTYLHPATGFFATVLAGAGSVWTNMPAAATEFLGNASRRIFADLTSMAFFRFFVGYSVVGSAGSVVRLQYTADLTGAAGWTTIGADQAISGAAGLYIGSSTSLPAAARGPVLLRVEGQGGDAIADPTFVEIGVMFRG